MVRVIGCIAVQMIVCGSTLAAGPVGWRGDTSGRFEVADPPTQWSQAEHVVWKTKLPAHSNGSPVVAGGKVFVTAEPTSIVCLDAQDGSILWQAKSGYDKVLSASELEAANRDLEQAGGIRKQIDGLRKELDSVEKKLREDADNHGLKDQREALKARIQLRQDELKPLEKFRIPEKSAGCTTPTSVSDGRHVFALFGTGIAACYDLDGGQKWIKRFDAPDSDWGHTASPLLAGKRLIAHFSELTAIDADSGSAAWSVKLPPQYGSPVLARVDGQDGGQDGGQDWIVTPGANIVRLADGKLLAEKFTKPLDRSSPIVEANVAYFVQAQARAFRLSAKPDAAAAELLWETNLANENYFASPLVLGGLLYTVSENRVFTVVDTASGEHVYQERLRFKSRGAVVSSLVAAGPYIYITNEAGSTKVIRAGREYEEVAENSLQHLRSSLALAGNRLYVRTMDYLYCIE